MDLSNNIYVHSYTYLIYSLNKIKVKLAQTYTNLPVEIITVNGTTSFTDQIRFDILSFNFKSIIEDILITNFGHLSSLQIHQYLFYNFRVNLFFSRFLLLSLTPPPQNYTKDF